MSQIGVVDFIVGLLVIALGGFIHWQYGRRRIARLFALSAFCGGMWCVGAIVYFGNFSEYFKGWYIDIFFIFAPLTLATSFHLIVVFSRSESPLNRGLVKLAYASCFVMAVIKFIVCPPSQFHPHMDINNDWDMAQGVAGWFIASCVILPLYSDYVLLKKYLTTKSGTEKNQLAIFLAAHVVGLIVLVTAHGERAKWQQLLSALIDWGCLTYLIARHRLFDLSFTLRKGGAAFLAGFPLALVFCGLLYLATLAAAWLGFRPISGAFSASFILVFFSYPLYHFFDKRIQKWMNIRNLHSPVFQAGYSGLLMRQATLQGYLDVLLPKIALDFGLKNVGFFWRDKQDEGWVFKSCLPGDWHPEIGYAESPLFLNAVAASSQGLYIEEVELSEEGPWWGTQKNELSETMRTLDCEVAHPLRPAGWLQGILLLGGKVTNRIFNPDEFDFFDIVSDHLGIALDRGRTQAALTATDHAARHDALTGLPNRKHFNETLDRMLAEAEVGEGRSMALLFMDLDLFKWINDNLGHAAGDKVLRIASQRMRNCVAEEDLVVRLGGDEFVIVANIVEASEARVLCQRLLAAIGEEMDLDGTKARIGCSIGVSLYPGDARRKAELIQRADEALYLAKVPRNVARFYNEDVRSRALEREELKAGYEAAFGRGEFLLHYQPQWDVAGVRVVGAEALLRWEHPQRGLLRAGTFMDAVEDLGVQDSLGLWEFEQAALQARAWASEGHAALSLAVNLSPKRLQDRRLAEKLLEILRRHRVDARCFQLEIAESAALKSSGTFVETLKPVRRAGMRVYLDGFMGHASINALRRLDVDGIKIDRALVHGIGKDRDLESQLKASVALGKSLGMDVVALGLENREQLDYLKMEGCARIQGNYWGAPAAAAELEKILEKSGMR